MFTVRGNPVAKARARSRIVSPKNKKQFVTHYTPKKTVDNESIIAAAGLVEMVGRSLETGPLELIVDSYMRIPPSWPQKKQQYAMTGLIRPISKPDWDNLGKLVSDSLNGVVWVDDSQIVSGTSRKFYGDDPRTVITIRSWSSDIIF